MEWLRNCVTIDLKPPVWVAVIIRVLEVVVGVLIIRNIKAKNANSNYSKPE